MSERDDCCAIRDCDTRHSSIIVDQTRDAFVVIPFTFLVYGAYSRFNRSTVDVNRSYTVRVGKENMMYDV